MDLSWIEKIVLPIGSGILGAGATLWKMTAAIVRDIEDIKRRLAEAETELTAVKIVNDALTRDNAQKTHQLDTLNRDLERQNHSVTLFTEEQREQWQELYRTLGQIEGELGATRPPPAATRRGSRT